MTNEDAYNIADVQGLTEEERAALADDDAPAPPAVEEEESAETVEMRHDPVPILTARAPDNAAAMLDRISQFENDVERRFYDGELNAREYRDGLRQVSEAREEVRWKQRKADLAREFTETAESNAWYSAVDEFMGTTGAGIAKNEPALLAFDQYVKKVTADPANQKLSDRAQLEKAHKLFVADFGAAFGGPAHQPAGDGGRGDLGGGKYAALDRLATTDPLAYEKAIAKMSDAEQAEYLRTA